MASLRAAGGVNAPGLAAASDDPTGGGGQSARGGNTRASALGSTSIATFS